MKVLRKSFEESSVLLDVHADSLREIFRVTTTHLVQRGVIAAEDQLAVEEALAAREAQASTAIGHAVAVPHVYMPAFTEPTVVFVRLARPLNLGAPDGIPTRFVFFLLGPEAAVSQHLDTLANIARMMADDQFRYDARRAGSSRALTEALERFLVRMKGAVPAEAKPGLAEGLVFTGRPGGGIVGDLKRRLPHYASDFIDGLHPKCLASVLFLFFACLAPTVTFGGLLSVHTGQSIGVAEMLLATAIGGIVYALFSGQPLIILGHTGPLLAFTTLLYQVCREWELEFLPVYAWIGLWSALWVGLLAFFDASALMRYFTRFTDETFAAMISLIYIFEALNSLSHEFQVLDHSHQRATAFLTLLLALGTLYVATSLSRFRRSHFLRGWIREFLADFGPAVAMAVMTAVAVWFHVVDLETLNVPDHFATTSGRPWLIHFWDVPMWIKLGAAVPAVLVALLIFLDQNITARLVNSRDHKLQKGEAYHLDLLIVGGLIGAFSLFGLPWLVAATVRSLNHVRSLATTEEVVAGNQSRERIIHVRENRVTPLAIHLLIGMSVVALATLQYIPLAVLYGLFLYMGVVSIRGNQFFERLSLWIKDPQLYPATHYIRNVPKWTIHRFTLLQFAGLAILWGVKTSKVSAVALLFPLVIALLVPIRLLAGRFFSKEHLEALDADEEPEQEDTHWGG